MNTYTFDLEFHSPFPLKDRGLPNGATANISIKHLTVDEKGEPVVTPDCITMRELDSQIDRLKEELEQVRILASKKFSRHDELEREWTMKHRESEESKS
jgi:hypothetical protein